MFMFDGGNKGKNYWAVIVLPIVVALFALLSIVCYTR